MNVEGIWKELDSLSLRHLELLNQHVMLSKDLEVTMRNGWLHLSKTRYVMGYSLSSVAQFDDRERRTSLPVDVSQSDEEPWAHFSIQQRGEEDEVRRRFGVLSPQSAKQSRSCFIKSAQLAVELATVRAELLLTMKKIEELNAMKANAVVTVT